MINTTEAIKRGARLIEEEDLKKLVESVEGLPPISRKAFVDLVSADGYDKIIHWTHEISQLIHEGRKPQEVLQALAIVDALTPAELGDVESLKRKIRQRIQNAEDIGREVANAIRQVAGDLVDKI